MEQLPVDIDPKQIVRWIIAEHRITPSSLKIVARRTTEERQIPARAEFHLGDEEREDLSEIATVATLEIAPAHPSDGWLMTITVEDEIGPRGPISSSTVMVICQPSDGRAGAISRVATVATSLRSSRSSSPR
jgi:hypothetical protein